MNFSSSKSPLALPLGPLMVDIAGYALTLGERDRLCHPLVGSVILFARNYANPEQLRALTDEIHALRTPQLLIAIDHEGGRVQRCREGFTRLPAMNALGRCWEKSPEKAKSLAYDVGYVLAAELRALGVDFSFTPVLDLDYQRSEVIGDRSFHRDPNIVVTLAGALIEGLRQGGMGCCGKHFPGHGWVKADSHLDIPVDGRSLENLQEDILPYRELPLDAIMPAHVIYPEVDEKTACFSKKWLGYLRDEIGFSGLLLSDDLSMAGAKVAGGIVERVTAAWEAGCDMLLICNDPEKAEEVLKAWQPTPDRVRESRRAVRLLALSPQNTVPNWAGLPGQPEYIRAQKAISTLLA